MGTLAHIDKLGSHRGQPDAAYDQLGPQSRLGAKRWRLTFYFVSTVIFAITVTVLVAGLVAERQAGNKLSAITKMEIKREALQIQAIAQDRTNALGFELDPGSVEFSAITQALIDDFGLLIRQLDLVGVRHLDLEGNQLWSSGLEMVGTAPGEISLINEAVENGFASRLQLNQVLANGSASQTQSDIVEYYVPIRNANTGSITSVLQAKRDVSAELLAQSREAKINAFWISLGATGSLLIILLGFIVTADLSIERNRKRQRSLAEGRLAERNQAQEQLDTSKNRLRALSYAGSEAVVITEDGAISQVNSAFTTIFGHDSQALVGQPDLAMVVPEPGATLLQEASQSEGTSVVEVIGQRKDGSSIIIEVTTKKVPLGNKGGQVTVLRDITDQKLTEEALREANLALEDFYQNLENRVQERTLELEDANTRLVESQDQVIRAEKLAAIGQVAGGVAHDLRSPLGGIKNALYYLKTRLADSEIAQSNPRIPAFLQVIEDEVHHANKTIADLLGESRIDLVSTVPIDVTQVVESALSAAETNEKFTFSTQFSQDLPYVLGDSEQLRRVFINLIANAQQAMPEGGNLSISGSQIEGSVQLHFSDTGVGVSEEQLKKIFDPLFTTKPNGTGLGLSICHQIITQHNGRIGVSSELGKGTTFTVTLPIGTESE